MLVVKVGGSRGINYEAVCADVAALVRDGTRLVLVHGGSHETNVISERLGKPPRTLTSVSGFTSRYTDAETLDIFAMVYCGKVQKRLVEKLQRLGCNAVGLSGVDGRLLEGPRKSAITIIEGSKKRVIRDDFTGRVERVNADLLTTLLDAGYTPVIAPLAISYESEAINVDGDRAAAAIATALGAERLVILSNVPGLLRQYPDETTLIPRLARVGLEEALSFAEGRMKKKVLGAAEAFAGGVYQVIFADGRVERPIRAALAGRGTLIE